MIKKAISDFLIFIIRFTIAKPLFTIFIIILLFIFSLSLVSQLVILPTWLDLLPKNNPSLKKYNAIREQFGNVNPIIFSVEAKDPNQLPKRIDQLRLILEKSPFIKQVNFRLDKESILQPSFSLTASKSPFKIPVTNENINITKIFQKINQTLSEKEATNLISERKLSLLRRGSLLLGLNILDQLSLLPGHLDPYLEGESFSEKLYSRIGYFIAPDQHIALVSVLPTFGVDDIQDILIGVPSFYNIVENFEREYPDTTVRFGGRQVITYEEISIINADAVKLTVLTFIFILIFFIFVFKSWYPPLIAMTVLSVGISFDLALTYIFFKDLNIITSIAALLLIGLGVDFFIHFYNGILNENKNEPCLKTSIIKATKKIGPSIFLGGLSTSLAFYALLINNLSIFREMGMVMGTGILMNMLITLTLLPPILISIEKINSKNSFVKFLPYLAILPIPLILIDKVNSLIRKKVQIEFSFFKKYSAFLKVYYKQVFIVSLIFIGFIISFYPQVKFDFDILNMQSSKMQTVPLLREVLARYGISDAPLFYVNKDINKMQENYQKLIEIPEVAFVDSLAIFIGDKNKSQENFKFKTQIIQDKEQFNQEIIQFTYLLNQYQDKKSINLKSDWNFNKILNRYWNSENTNKVQNLLNSLSLEEINEFQNGISDSINLWLKNNENKKFKENSTQLNLASNIISRYKKEGYYLSTVYPAIDGWEKPNNSIFQKKVLKVVPYSTGSIIMLGDLINEIGKSGQKALLFSFITILISLIFFFGHFLSVLIALLPMILGLLMTYGFMGLLDYPFTILMIVSLPLVIGIGIDNGIHLLHIHEEYNNFSRAILYIGSPLLITTITTMIGFFSLTLSRWDGFGGIGIVMSTGILSFFFISMTIVPCMLMLMNREHLLKK